MTNLTGGMKQNMQTHHSIARSRGGLDDPWNLVEKTDYGHTYDHAVDFVLFENSPAFDFRMPAWDILPNDLREAVLAEKSRRNSLLLHREKNSEGKSTHAVSSAHMLHSVKNSEGKSEAAVKAAHAMHSCKNENGKSIVAVNSGKKGAKTLNAQRWKCTLTGFESSVGGLNSYQKKRGIDFKNRIRTK